MAKGHDDNKEKMTYLLVASASLILLLISVVISDDFKTLASFLKELAFAGFIALIVIFTVEKFSKERHRIESEKLVKSINKNLFNAIYDRHIPNHVFREVEKLLLNNDVTRKNYSVIYTIEKIKDDDKHYKCTVQGSYDLENISDKDITHVVKGGLEKPLDENLIKNCGFIDFRCDGKSLSKQDIKKHTTLSNGQILFNYPIEMKAGATARINQVGSLIKLKTDQETWLANVSSDGFQLTVHAPEGVDFLAKSIHSTEADLVQDSETKKTWEIKSGMIPNQGFIFWWQTKA